MNADAVLRLARQDLRTLVPYTSYTSSRTQESMSSIMLDANESPWPPPGDVSAELNRYPEPQPSLLRDALARLYTVTSQQVLIGRGSDETIDLLVRAFCRAGQDAVLVCPPTFSQYAFCAGVQGGGVVEVPLNTDFGVDPGAILAACSDAVKIVFVCTPNNPTGGCVSLECIRQLADALKTRALVVVDEAYIEFADIPSAARLLKQHPNLVVLRTLSKAWALAGARIGALLAHADIVALLRCVMSPFPLPKPSVQAAVDALRHADEMRRRVSVIKRERTRLLQSLVKLPAVARVLPSDANFLTVRFHKAEEVLKQLSAAGILVRDLRRNPRLEDALRLTIGTSSQNDALLSALVKLSGARRAAS